MELTGIDWAFIAGLAGTFLKSLLSDRKAAKAEDQARSIVADREQTKQERDREHKDLVTRVALLEQMREVNEKRLEAGTKEFERINDKLDRQTYQLGRTNDLLNQLIGAAKAGGLNIKPSVPMDGKMDL